MLLSMTGTFLFLLVLSARIFIASESSCMAGGVFAAQWLPAIFLLPLIVQLCSRFSPVRLLPVLEIFSAVVTICTALAADHGVFAVFGLLFVRGGLEATTKSARLVALKRYMPAHLLEQASSVFNTSTYIGAGLGGLLGSLVVEHLSLISIGAIDAGTFLVAAILYALVQPPTVESKAQVPMDAFSVWRKAKDVLSREHRLTEYVVSLVILTGVYQGFHVIARTVIPISILSVGPKGVTDYQIVTCVGLVSAGFFVYRFMCGEARGQYNPLALFCITSLSMISTVFAPNLLTGLISYLLFIFLFEVNYTKCMTLIIDRCPSEELPILLPFINSATMIAMVLVVFGGGQAMDDWGFVPVTIGLAGAALLLAIFSFAGIRRFCFRFSIAIGEKT